MFNTTEPPKTQAPLVPSASSQRTKVPTTDAQWRALLRSFASKAAATRLIWPGLSFAMPLEEALARDKTAGGGGYAYDSADGLGWMPQDIADALCGDVDRMGVLAPKEGHSDEDRSLRVLVGDQYPDGYWVCSAFKGESEDWPQLLEYVLSLCPFLPVRGKPTAPLTDEQRAERARRRAEQDEKDAKEAARKHAGWLARWNDATVEPHPLGRTLVGDYLGSRKLELPLNVFRRSIFEYKQVRGMAYGMMAQIVRPETGDCFAFHVTYLDSAARKTWGREKVDRITPGMTSANGVGVIKLVTGASALCIGEGIETALSFRHLPRAKGATIWAGIHAPNLRKIEPLDAFGSIMIAVDIEPSGAGEIAAKELATRWARAGKRTFLVYPTLPEGKDKWDLNDVAQIEGGPVEDVHYRIEKFEAQPDLGGGDKGKAKRAKRSSKGDAQIGDNSGERDTELGNAHRLVHQHGDDIRYVHHFKSWFVWEENFWRRDETGEIMRRAEGTIEALFDEAKAISSDTQRGALRKWALKSQTRAAMENMVALARHQPGVALSPDALDTDPMLLGVLNGVIDLNTGTLHKGRREDYITKRAGATFDAGAQCPNWLAFQNKITGGDAELIAYKQRLAGLLLTGLVVETLFILHGGGANGKTTEMETFHAVLGDYAHAADASLLMPPKDQSGPKPEIVALKGKRAVFINETSENAWLNESRVKYLAGKDTLSGRDLWEKLINFSPTHKPILRTNHKPQIRGTDLGIWRRINYVPYLVTIADDEKDERFREKYLVPELPGILNWMLAGLKEYLRIGLKPPLVVCEATKEYREDSDSVGKWISAAITVTKDDKDGVLLTILHQHYMSWARDEMQIRKGVSSKKLAAALRERNIDDSILDGRAIFKGIKLNWEATSPYSSRYDINDADPF